MNKRLALILILAMLLVGCSAEKEGENYPLIVNATVSYQQEHMKDWVAAIGNKEAVGSLKASGHYDFIPLGNNNVTLLEKQGKVCKVLLKDYNGKTAYTACDYIIFD